MSEELGELEEIARVATQKALENYIIPEEYEENLVLSTQFDGDNRIFEYALEQGPKKWIQSALTLRSNSLTYSLGLNNNMLEQFNELEDRYEKELNGDSYQVLVSVDKTDATDLTDAILTHIVENIKEIVTETLKFFEDNKESYEVDFVDDLSDPQIILSSDGFSVFWWSEKGEEQGAGIIGIDYHWPHTLPQDITIGD